MGKTSPAQSSVPAGDFFRPDSVLATMDIDPAPVAFTKPRVGYRRATDLILRFGIAQLRLLMAGMRTGLAVPVADEVSVNPECEQHLWARLHSITGRKSEAPSRRATCDSHPFRVEMKLLRALAAAPFEGIFQVLNDPGQLRLWCQAIVDRNEDAPIFSRPVLNSTADR